VITRPTLSPGPTLDDATAGLALSMDGVNAGDIPYPDAGVIPYRAPGIAV